MGPACVGSWNELFKRRIKTKWASRGFVLLYPVQARTYAVAVGMFLMAVAEAGENEGHPLGSNAG
jgi:hypothetical protein